MKLTKKQIKHLDMMVKHNGSCEFDKDNCKYCLFLMNCRSRFCFIGMRYEDDYIGPEDDKGKYLDSMALKTIQQFKLEILLELSE